MFDRIFSAALAFIVLTGGTLAIGSEMLGWNSHAQPARSGAHASVIQLPTVQVTGQRVRDMAQQETTEPAQRAVQ